MGLPATRLGAVVSGVVTRFAGVAPGSHGESTGELRSASILARRGWGAGGHGNASCVAASRGCRSRRGLLSGISVHRPRMVSDDRAGCRLRSPDLGPGRTSCPGRVAVRDCRRPARAATSARSLSSGHWRCKARSGGLQWIGGSQRAMPVLLIGAAAAAIAVTTEDASTRSTPILAGAGQRRARTSDRPRSSWRRFDGPGVRDPLDSWAASSRLGPARASKAGLALTCAEPTRCICRGWRERPSRLEPATFEMKMPFLGLLRRRRPVSIWVPALRGCAGG